MSNDWFQKVSLDNTGEQVYTQCVHVVLKRVMQYSPMLLYDLKNVVCYGISMLCYEILCYAIVYV